MKQRFVIQEGNQSLALFFAGWGSSGELLNGINAPCDVMIAWDFADFDFDISQIAGYKNIYLFAWSFGIVGAMHLMAEYPRLPIVLRVAINGTQEPISDHNGIPVNIFEGTAKNLNERNLQKFYRRMCSSAVAHTAFMSTNPIMDVDSLREQLYNVKNAQPTLMKQQWDKVIISQNDFIFPIENCLNDWNGYCKELVIEDHGYHLPESFEQIICSNVIDKDLIRERFSESFSTTYDAEAQVQGDIAQRMVELWKSYATTNEGCSVLEVGCGSGIFTRKYLPVLYPSKLVLNDLCAEPDVVVNLTTTQYQFLQCDAETIELPDESVDYITSTSALQWFENLESFFAKAYTWLKPGGYLIFSTFGTDNLREIRQITNAGLNYRDIDVLKAMLLKHFEIIFADEERNVMHFDSPIDVLRHIKKTGVNSLIKGENTQSQVRKLIKNYNKVEFEGKKVCPLTYHPIYIISRKNG